jgi:sporulation protein YlmC with PRC-barrel domain
MTAKSKSMGMGMPKVMVLDVHRADLMNLPMFMSNKWPDMGDHDRRKEIHEFYMRASRCYADAANRTGSVVQSMYDGEGMSQYRRLSHLMGWTVINRDHARLGSLDDVALDLESGHTVYALVGHGGSSGRSKQEAVIPWSALTIDRGGTFANLDLHECSTAAWIHQIFDQEPFWMTYGYVEPGSPGSGAGRSMGGE